MFHLIKNSSCIYAHKGSGKKETLYEHAMLTKYYLDKINGIKDIEEKVKQLLKSAFGIADAERGWQLFQQGITCHDLGKINPSFQADRMDNRLFKITTPTEHSIISSILFIQAYESEFETDDTMTLLLYVLAFAISRHHGYLTDLVLQSDSKHVQDFNEKILSILRFDDIFLNWEMDKPDISQMEELLDYSNHILTSSDTVKDPLSFYVLIKLFYGLLVTCDFYSTYQYKNKCEVDLKYIKDSDAFNYKYYNSKIYKDIQKYKNDKDYFKEQPINVLRSEIFLETHDSLLQSEDKNIYYYEAPTGSGKTNTSISLALQLVKDCGLQSVFYAFPFNTLVDQTKDFLSEFFEVGVEMAPINAITKIDKLEKTYDEALLDRQFSHYPITITSHVNLFNGLFGASRHQNFLLPRLMNSVIILDEFQCYNNKIWREIALFMDTYAKFLNIKLIIMSATLPKLSYFIEDKSIYTNLIKDASIYYQNPLFKDRVHLDYSLLERGYISQEDLISKIRSVSKPDKNTLIEFIKKKTARMFYKELKKAYKNDTSMKVLELSGDDNALYRRMVIERIKEEKGLIIVATQVIEAGVDIDCDIGFKDCSILDSEEQMAGRLNRSCFKEGCMLYFFCYDPASHIYKGDARLDFTIEDKVYRKLFKEKDFNTYYESVMEVLKKRTSGYNTSNIESVKKSAKYLQFEMIQKHMLLIEKNDYQIVLNFKQTIDGKEISGKEVWNKYRNLLNCTLDYSEKEVKILELKELLSLFTYNISESIAPSGYNDSIGNSLYYYEDGEIFMDEEDGYYKFDREKFEKGGLIL